MSPIWERKGVSRLHVFILALLLVSCLIMPVPGVYATLTVTQPSIADTCINEELPNKNYGWHPDIFVNAYSAGRERALVKFDLSGISSGASINSARLKLYYCDAFGNPAGRTFNAYRVTKDWVEYQATWNDYSAGHPWTNPGGDYTTEGGSSSTVPATIGQWMVWDVTAIVKAWIEGGQPNCGFIIKDKSEDAPEPRYASFYSKEGPTPEWRPILEVDWSRPVGGVLVPVNKPAILTPYLTLLGLIGAIAIISVTLRRRVT